VPSETAAGWTLRLVDLLGARLDQVTEEHLENLVTGGVREDSDLDFKHTRYGNTDQQRRDLAGDLAAMANSRGGLILIGIHDENDVAVELTPVDLIDGEEARIRQIAAGNIAPHLMFDVRVIESAGDPERGYYLLIVPPSTLRPHAVRQDRNLRYPLRHGTTTRWLSEPEVADMYRDRFAVAAGQTQRLGQILTDGLNAMVLAEEAFIAVALVPTGAGSMPIDLASVAAVGEWATNDIGPVNWFEGFFDRQAPPASPRVAANRLTLTTVYETSEPPGWVYVELYDDGAGFACHRLTDPRRAWQGGERPDAWILNEQLLFQLARSLLLLGRHAGENCGAWGDALVEARLVSPKPMRLAYLFGPHNQADEIDGGRQLPSPVVSRATTVIDGLARPGPELLVTTRLLATGLFHAFGSPEVRQITPDGRLRIRHIHDDHTQLRAWAERHGIEITDETVQ
jgi:hypothetical protein